MKSSNSKEVIMDYYDEIISEINASHRDNFDLFAGDCGNFAEALGNVVDPEQNVYACSYENETSFLEGEPAHCGLIWQDRFWDGRGDMSLSDAKKYLYYKAIVETPPNLDDIIVDLPVPASVGNNAFKSIYDPDRVELLESIISRILG